jgi:hypothetical protein
VNRVDHELPKTVAIRDLVPTQVTAGMREVYIKRKRWREKNSHEAATYLNRHHIPVILGPDRRHYMIDRHHLALALHQEGVREVPISIIANMNNLSLDDFRTILKSCNWTHPFDNEGRRCSYDEMPATVDDLIDDPFRSLAGELKRAGGYAKNRAPFSEFRWADFLRRRIAHHLIERDFPYTLALAMKLAQGNEAAALPGWRGDTIAAPDSGS